jgi:hypothetical protein
MAQNLTALAATFKLQADLAWVQISPRQPLVALSISSAVLATLAATLLSKLAAQVLVGREAT